MDYKTWLKLRAGDIRTNRMGGLKRSVNDVYRRLLRNLWVWFGTSYGTNIYEREWDVLLVLDACRYDLMLEVADEFDYLPTVDSFESVGTGTRNWMENTFVAPYEVYRDEIARTLYINANPNSEDILDASDFYELDDVWRYGYEEELYVTPPRVVTDRLIETFRNGTPPERVIAHYMQPHEPYLRHMDLTQYTSDTYEHSIWHSVLRGRIDREDVMDAYRDNLRYVLEELEILLDNLDAESVVITSDHGEATGEWGLYAHGGPPIEELITVPWIEIGETTDRETHEPDDHRESTVERTREDQLRDLGYMQ